MKILLVVPRDQEVGGVSVIAGNLARYLHAQSHEVLFLTPGRVISPRSITTNWGFPGFEMRLQLPFGQRHSFVSLPLFTVLFPLIIYQLIRFIRREQIQIVNVHYAMNRNFYFAICRQLLNVKLVTSIHGGDVFPGGETRANDSWFCRSLFNASDLIIAPSRRFCDDFVAVFPHHAAKAHFIHNGIDPCEFRGSPLEYHHSGDTRYILSVASYHRYKGLDVLIQSFGLLAGFESKTKLLLAGDGPERQNLEELAKSLGVHDRIEFLGWQGRKQVKELLFACDVFVLPSRWESFGLVLLEALACGIPVVATKVVGIPEVIEEGTNGLLVESENPLALAAALKRILTDHDLQRLFAGNGRKIVRERFRFKQTGSRYESFFDQLLSQELGSQLRVTQNDP